MFPNIVNCTSIVWYVQWPDEGLEAVALKQASKMFLEARSVTSVVSLAKQMHNSALQLAEDFRRKENRVVYITPSSYLDLLNYIKDLLRSQTEKL